MDKRESYPAAHEHRECYEGLIKSYNLDKTLFSTYDKEPEFEVADSDMPQDQEGNLGNDDDKPMKETISKRDWFTKPTQPQEPTDLDWNVGKNQQQGQTQSWLTTLASFADKPLLKGTRSNYVELEYDFEEGYKALSKKLDWENQEGGDYPFDLTKPLPLVMSGNSQKVPIDYFFNNDLKYMQGGVLTMTYMTSITKTKAAQYDLPSIEDMVPNIRVPVKVEVMRKHGYGYLKEIVVRRADNDLYRFKEDDFPRLHINDIEDIYQKKINVTKPKTTRLGLRKRDPFTLYQDPQGFIYVDNQERNRLIRSDELYKFCDGTLTSLLTSLEDIINNVNMEYLPKRRWSTLEKKISHIMIKAINKLQKERMIMRSLEKFVGGRHYGTDLLLLQRTM
ncbi:hypothetical protein Tco_0918894 [Tanacetum coccineum]